MEEILVPSGRKRIRFPVKGVTTNARALCALTALVLCLGAVLPGRVSGQDLSEPSLRPKPDELLVPEMTPEEALLRPLRPTTKTTDEETSREELRRQLVTPSVDLPGAVDPDAYHVGPGDMLQVIVWGGVARTFPLEIGPEGTVVLPSSGTLRVDGMPLSQARKEILARLRPEFRGVNLDVRLAKPRRFLVYVTGQVKVPGGIEATGASRVGDIVLKTDPLKNAALRSIEVLHRDGSTETADLELFLRTGSQQLNPWLRDGDVLHVPGASRFVYINGAVSRPLKYELGPRDSLHTLIDLGGGLIPAADSSRALFVRWIDGARSESLWVDVPAVVSRKYDPPLRTGDRLYVFFVPQFQIQNEVTLLGEVRRPGIYPVKVGRDKVSDVLRAAGGFLPGADLAAIRVRRANPEGGATDPELQRLLRLSRRELTNSEYDVLQTKLAGLREEYRIDWNRIQSDPDLDVLMVGGDIVQVDRVVRSIRVDGQVRRPGIVSYEPGLSVMDYVRATGGYSERAWRGKVRVTRLVTGQTLLARDVQKLDPGDFIWVPERPDVTFWEQARTVLSAAAEIATVVLAFRAVNR